MSSIEDFDKSLRISKFTLNMTGLYIGKPKNTWAEYIKNTWFYYFNLQILYTDIVGEFIWFFEKFQVGLSFNEVTFMVPCITMCLLGSMKAAYVFMNDSHVMSLINRLRELHPKFNVEEQHQNTAEGKLNKIIDEAMKVLNFVVNVLSCTNAALYVAVICTPIILMVVVYYNTGDVKLYYPVLVSYPYINSSDIRVWPFAFVHQSWSGTVALLYIIGSDTLLYSFCTLLNIQFKILGYKIETVVEKSKGITNKIDKEELHYNLGNIVKYHQELIELVLKVDIIYSKSMLFNFITSSFLICLSGFNLTMTQDMSNIASFIVFLVSSLSQVYILCFFGDMITRSSIEVCDAIDRSDWPLATTSFKKSIVLMIIRSQKGCKLTAYKFTDVNLRAFTKVLSRSWSYFALLKTVYSVDSY